MNGGLETTAIRSAALAPMKTDGFLLRPTTFDEAWRVAQVIAKTNFCPKDMRGRPEEVLACLCMGAELGFSPMQALSSIAVINGRPGLFGDGLLGVVRRDPSIVSIRETIEGEGDDMTAICTILRTTGGTVKNSETTTRSFSVADAKQAGLWMKKGKEGQDTPWVTYPKRMLQMRARSWAIRDAAADLTRGIGMIEELQDVPPMVNVTPTNYEPVEGETPEDTDEIFMLATALGLKRAQVMLEIRRDGHEKVLERLRAESSPKTVSPAEPPADASGEAAGAEPAAEETPDSSAPRQLMTDPTKKHIFALFKEAGIAQIPKGLRGKAREEAEEKAKSERITFAAELDVFVASYGDLYEDDAQKILEALRARVASIGTPVSAVDCDFCGVGAGQPHFANCEAAE